LAHENEHARRRDPLVHWLALLSRCVFWFHPLAWWLERKLVALAEEACDAAVLAQGHDPRDYAEYLVHLARSVQRAGKRVQAWGTAMDSGTLRARIERILDSRPAPALSRTRAAGVAVCCGMVLALFAGCKLDRTQKPAPGQPTMNELLHRQADRSQEWNAKDLAAREEAGSLTPEQAQALEQRVKSNPDDRQALSKLGLYFMLKSDVGGRIRVTLWMIEHHPDNPGNSWQIDPRWGRAAFERGKTLWLANLKKTGASSEVYRWASRYMAATDPPLAEQILLDGQRANPEYREGYRSQDGKTVQPRSTVWQRELGQLYAGVLAGPERDGQFAQKVQEKLSASQDTNLLFQTAQALRMQSDMVHADTSVPRFALARTFVERVLALDPNYGPASQLKTVLALTADELRFHAMTPEQIAQLGVSDRMKYLDLQASQWTPNKPGEKDAAAHELLDLARKNSRDPTYGDAIFDANMQLGRAALRQRDKRTAAKYLLAAAETPGSERLKYNGADIPMNLPRELVDWGERDAVAQFLERSARLVEDSRAKQFQDWAAEIRKGINPDLTPTFSGLSENGGTVRK